MIGLRFMAAAPINPDLSNILTALIHRSNLMLTMLIILFLNSQQLLIEYFIIVAKHVA
jgi:hypothetical protein